MEIYAIQLIERDDFEIEMEEGKYLIFQNKLKCQSKCDKLNEIYNALVYEVTTIPLVDSVPHLLPFTIF
jgi:hypothetical protein